MTESGRFRRFLYKSRSALLVLLAVFLIAQVGWWIIFQVRIDKRLTEEQEELWRQQIALADRFLDSHPNPESGAQQFWLRTTYPDLVISEEGQVEVRPEARRKLEEKAGKAVRMFTFEGGFFAIIVLLGIFYMYWTLRREVRLERQQTNFLSAITHELKTPVTAVRLLHESLQYDDTPPEQREEVNKGILRNLNRLTHLIDRLLLARSLTGEKLQATSHLINAGKETERVLTEYHATLPSERQPDLSWEVEGEVTLRLASDFWELVVVNLVENAIKYSDPGDKVTVSLVHRRRRCRLIVTDEGVGFSHAERKVVFKKFYRVGDEDTRRTEGAGLGLYLVREIIHSFGGKIKASSPGPGQGATFTVTLPLEK